MPPDATEIKRRLMKAAVDEFTEHGLAGARIDRIAESASANKRSIYMHFGTKEAVRQGGRRHFLELAASIPFGDDHLVGYAGDLFDRLEQWPHVRRLYLWASNENSPSSPRSRDTAGGPSRSRPLRKRATFAPTSHRRNSWPW
jgi:AcrR family transcriptional regulator